MSDQTIHIEEFPSFLTSSFEENFKRFCNELIISYKDDPIDNRTEDERIYERMGL